MTDDELAAIRARAEAARAATEGPTLSDQLAAWFDDGPRKMADSQRDVSVLLAEVDRLRGKKRCRFCGIELEGGGSTHPGLCPNGPPTDRITLVNYHADGSWTAA